MERNVSPRAVEDEIRGHTYAVLATVSPDCRPHSTGILYAVAPGVTLDSPLFAIYIVTSENSKKAKDIASNPNVSLAIPLTRAILRFMPPNSIQFRGSASLVQPDGDIRKAFAKTLALRATYRTVEERSPEDPPGACVIRVRPSRVIHTYGVGLSALQLMKNFEGASSTLVRAPGQQTHGSSR